MPRIRAEAFNIQIPPPPTSGRNAYQMQKEPEPSLPGSVSAGFFNRKPYRSHEDEDGDELGDRFTQLHIKSTSTAPTRPTHRESPSSKQRGELNPNLFTQPHSLSNFDPIQFWNPNRRLYAHKEAEDDSVAIGFCGNWSGMNAVESKPNDPAFMPTISGRGLGVRNPPPSTSGRNGYQMEKGTSMLSSVSPGYSKRELYNRHEDNEVHYKYSYKEEVEVKYQYPVPYEEEGKLGNEYQALCEAKDDEEQDVYTGIKRLFHCCITNSEEEYGCGYQVLCEAKDDEEEDVYIGIKRLFDGSISNSEEEYGCGYQVLCEAKDDEEEDVYTGIKRLFDGCITNSEEEYGYGYSFPYEDGGNMEGEVEYENPLYTVPYEDEGEVENHYILTVFCEDDFKYPVACEGNGYRFPHEHLNYPVPYEGEGDVLYMPFCEVSFK